MNIIEKVEKLLRKAADETVTPAEAIALKEKAEELLVKNSIDRAMLNLGDKSVSEKITSAMLTVSYPYKNDKIILLSAVADAFGCQCVYTGDDVTLIGYMSDLEKVKFLYVNLQIQSVGMLLEAEFEDEPKGDITAYRKSFFLGFTQKVKERLAKFTKAAVSETTGSELVLFDRAQAVRSEMEKLFPKTKKMQISRSSYSGYNSGKVAGGKADIGITGVGRKGQKSIGG